MIEPINPCIGDWLLDIKEFLFIKLFLSDSKNPILLLLESILIKNIFICLYIASN